MQMAENRRYLPNQLLDLEQILEEAKYRWLRPTEILEILCNYQRFKLTPEPPVKPSAGSLFLFDRKALRYFRKDGHCWRKKNDGKTVREAHEKLKASSVDVLHCYYAHGEDNGNFQRRCYWMLDGKLEHIVLVHYREVKEGYRCGVSRLLADPVAQVENHQPISAPSFLQTVSPAFTAETSYASSLNRTDWNGQKLSSEFDDVDSRDDVGASTESIHGSMQHNGSFPATKVEGFPVSSRNPSGSWFLGAKFDHSTVSSVWTEIPSISRAAYHVQDQRFYLGQPSGADLITHKSTDSGLDGNVPDTVATADRLSADVDDQALVVVSQRLSQERDFNLVPLEFLDYAGSQIAASPAQTDNKPQDGTANTNELGELKKLDSFGRWMDKEIGGDCDDSLMASDSGNYWNTLGADNEDKEVSSLSHHMHLDIESLGPSLSQEQLFSIRDFSPDWAYSGAETKVLIIGTFLGSKKFSSKTKWGCMFGEIEVSAEVLTDYVIRCQAPLHATGRVPFYVTCRNRLACSEVREFEYRENPSRIASLSVRSVQDEELRFQVRLVKLLYLGPDRNLLDCSIEGCNKCELRSTLYSVRNGNRENYMVSQVNCTDARDKLIQCLLKDKLCEWLVCKVHQEGKGPDVLDSDGQGVIHLTAGLGYEWAMGLIVAVSNNPNFRDAQGRTALHWASYFGREETVIELVRLGVDPTAVDDPTPAFPGGRIAADIASGQGHKGIAGFLAEAFLTRHLSSLNITENVSDSVAATIAAEKASEIVAQVSTTLNGGVYDQISLKGSLAAVRKSAIAAALIQAAYRSYSFHHQQFSKRGNNSEVSLDLATLGSLNKDQRRSHFEDYLHSAAVKVQQKYRGWKGRKEFLKIRNRIVKIQAHVRGCKVRKQYKKFIWSVSILEKAILRWRRKGSGLRGFQIEMARDTTPETDKTDEYEFLRISRKQKSDGVEKALARIQSMVRNPSARDQYMRLIIKSENLKLRDEGISISRQDGSSQQKRKGAE